MKIRIIIVFLLSMSTCRLDTSNGLSNAAMVFWSIVLGAIGAGVPIRAQSRQEPEKDFSLKIFLIHAIKGKQ